ncbi:hypothetical protein MA16_Dca022797 [Dendrobium catenatum]|uniref:Uncharacterized protein n=1 Tax=Dendrobium catenatum TaxID=906689 RepID=A0A2I0W7R3_9ASPA|nr:hypothetical protein MA16_Dca022797 [Dendrobium catenatum]
MSRGPPPPTRYISCLWAAITIQEDTRNWKKNLPGGLPSYKSYELVNQVNNYSIFPVIYVVVHDDANSSRPTYDVGHLVVFDLGIVDVPVASLDPLAADLKRATVHAGYSLVVSLTIVEKSPIGIIYGDNLLDELEGKCEVNKVVNVGLSNLCITIESSLVAVMNKSMGVLALAHFVDAPISLISNN